MTRYLCIHGSHRRDGKRVPVDLTDSVRLERSLIPRPSVYLAVTEDVIDQAVGMGPSVDRRREIERAISGDVEPANLPVVLVSERSSDRAPGRYEWDDLRRDTSLLDRLAAGPAGERPGDDTADDLILLEDDRDEPAGRAGVLTRRPPRVRVIPQGMFDLRELSARIAIAGNDEASVIDAIRSTPRAAAGEVAAETPWRVIVPCPVIEAGEGRHDVLFTGQEGLEPAVEYGTPASGIDESVETTAPGDLFPSAELARTERGATLLLTAEVVITTGVLLAAWASGALAVAAREHAGWLGLSLLLTASALAFAVLPQFVTRDPAANLNDVFDARRTYASRISLLGWASAISAVLLAVALVVGIAPTLDTDRVPVSSTSVSFVTSSSPVVATIEVDLRNAGSGDPVAIAVTSFSSADAAGTMVAQLSDIADENGTSETVRSVIMRPGDEFLTVAVGTGGTAPPACTPATGATTGCTIVAIPTSGRGTSATATAGATSDAAATVSVIGPAVTTPNPTSTPSP